MEFSPFNKYVKFNVFALIWYYIQGSSSAYKVLQHYSIFVFVIPLKTAFKLTGNLASSIHAIADVGSTIFSHDIVF